MASMGLHGATLTYNVPPPTGKLNGVAVSPNSPGIPPFAFHAQHGSWTSSIDTDSLTGFEACTTTVTGIVVQDGREAAERPRLVTHGFELASDGSCAMVEAHSHLRDDDYVRAVHYAEAERLALQLLPDAKFAKAFNHIRRRNRPTLNAHAPSQTTTPRHSTNLSSPSYMVHADSADASWMPRVRDLVASGEFDRCGPTHLRSSAHSAALAASDRIVVLNLWRLVTSFEQPVRTHLAMCDVRSVDLKRDTIPYHLHVDGCVGYNYGLDARHATHHTWYYFPRLKSHEVIAFKAYDSCEPQSNTQSWVFHGAVDDPTCSALQGEAPAAPRESLELRVVLAF